MACGTTIPVSSLPVPLTVTLHYFLASTEHRSFMSIILDVDVVPGIKLT